MRNGTSILVAMLLSVAGAAAVHADDIQSAGGIWALGWSDAGAFAYLNARSYGGPCPSCYSSSVIIVDLVEDQVLWQYDDPKQYDEETTPVPDLIAQYDSVIAGAFRTYGIDRSKRGRLESGTAFSAGGRSYSVRTDTETREETIHFQTDEGAAGDTTIDGVQSSRVVIASPSLGSKVVYTADTPNEGVSSASVLAAFVAPTENRAALVYRVVYGDPFIQARSEVRIIGAHLTIGYSK